MYPPHNYTMQSQVPTDYREQKKPYEIVSFLEESSRLMVLNPNSVSLMCFV